MDSKKQQLNFPPDVEEYIHRICINAVLRAIKNGTFKHPDYNPQEKKDEQPEKTEIE